MQYSENIRKRKKIQLVSCERRVKKPISKPTFKDRIISTPNLCAVESDQSCLTFDKAIFVGLTILEVIKWLMYYFHYKVMVDRYRNKINILYMDTDGIIYEIQTDNIYDDMIWRITHSPHILIHQIIHLITTAIP